MNGCNPGGDHSWVSMWQYPALHRRKDKSKANGTQCDCKRITTICARSTQFQMESGDTLPNVSTPGGQAGAWEWKSSTEKWVESSGKPVFRVVPDDTKPTLRDPLSTSDPTETEHFILRPPPFNKQGSQPLQAE